MDVRSSRMHGRYQARMWMEVVKGALSKSFDLADLAEGDCSMLMAVVDAVQMNHRLPPNHKDTG